MHEITDYPEQMQCVAADFTVLQGRAAGRR